MATTSMMDSASNYFEILLNLECACIDKEHMRNFLRRHMLVDNDWKEMIRHVDKYHPELLDWRWITLCFDLPDDFIDEFADKIDWEVASSMQSMSEDLMKKYSDRLDWDAISRCRMLSDEFTDEFKEKIDEYQKKIGDILKNAKS